MSRSSLLRPMMTSAVPFKLKLALNDQVIKEKDFSQDIVQIGRASDNDVILPDKKCSRYHARLVCEEGGVRLVNMSKSSPVFVNGKRIEENCILKGGEKIVLGKTELTFEALISLPPSTKGNMEAPKGKEPSPNHLRDVPLSNAMAPFSVSPPVKPLGDSLPAVEGHLSSASPLEKISPATSSDPSSDYAVPPRVKKRKEKLLIGSLAFLFLFSLFIFSYKPKPKTRLTIRTNVQIEKDLEQSRLNMQLHQQRFVGLKESGNLYRQAQAHYIRGFRDYRNGNFIRAIMAFQASLSLYPKHILSNLYLRLAKERWKERVQLYLIQGRKYYKTKNFQLCSSSFKSAMVMLEKKNSSLYREAKQMWSECTLMASGRY